MKNFCLFLEYDGTNYKGWQKQPGLSTVQGTVEKLLAKLLQHPVNLIAASRLDRGAHALSLPSNFITLRNISASVLKKALNKGLPEDIVVREVKEVPLKFHARYDARARVYEYKIMKSYSPFWRNYAWWCPDKIDIFLIKTSIPFFLGKKIIPLFDPRKHVEIIQSNFGEEDNFFILSISGKYFFHKMIRKIGGILIEIGRGKIKPETLPQILSQKITPPLLVLPPQGLYLKEVKY